MIFNHKNFKNDVVRLYNHIKEGKIKNDFKIIKDKILAVVNAPNVSYIEKRSNLSGIDVIFRNVMNYYEGDRLFEVVTLLNNDFHITKFEVALTNARGVVAKLGLKDEKYIIDKKIAPALPFYYEFVEGFKSQQKEFYKKFSKHLDDNIIR